MVYLFPLLMMYFDYVITSVANLTPIYNLLCVEKKNSTAWVGVSSEAEAGEAGVGPGLCF